MSAARSPSRRPELPDGDQVKLAPEAIEALAAAIVEAQKPDGALLDAEAAAKLLNVKASWVLGEARHDRIPWVPVGRYVRFNRDDLLAWSDARARGPRVPRTGNGPVPKGGEGQ